VTTLTDIKDTLKKHKERLSEKYGLSFMAVFGSYGRNQQREDSDVDILVDFKRPVGIEFIDLANELENILKQKVDLVSRNGVKAQYLKDIEQELSHV
jgi:predicted nucleotidyltransferase